MNILFVCQANVGRSQMAEAFYNFHTKSTDARSAGVEDFRQKYNHRPTSEIIEVMREKGIDISHQQIDVLTEEMVIDAHKIVVLCHQALCPQFLIENEKVVFIEVPDPYQKNEDMVRQIRDQIEEEVLKLTNHVYMSLISVNNMQSGL